MRFISFLTRIYHEICIRTLLLVLLISQENNKYSFNTKGKNIMEIAYQDGIEEGYFVSGCVSRKKHVVPQIMSILEN